MDPLTQATVGALYSQNVTSKKKLLKQATVVGAISGMAPDIDVFFNSDTDPLMYLEFHRQFTHSLIFIPIGALICAGLMWLLWFRKSDLKFKSLYLFSLFGYGSHATLDSCTSYGTQLFWPFTNYRVSWDSISIVDPLFTFPILALIIVAMIRKNTLLSRIALAFGALYISLGFIQKHRVLNFSEQLLANESYMEVSAKPSFANLLVFKVIVEYENEYSVFAVRMGLEPKIYEGDRIAKLNLERDFPNLKKDTVAYNDIQRFSWFSQGYVSMHPTQPNHVIDVRYSMLPNKIDPLWGISVDLDNPNEHTPFINYPRAAGDDLKSFPKMLRGEPIH